MYLRNLDIVYTISKAKQ